MVKLDIITTKNSWTPMTLKSCNYDSTWNRTKNLWTPMTLKHGNFYSTWNRRKINKTIRIYCSISACKQQHFWTITYPEMVFFIGLNVDVKIKISPFACSIARCSLRPTTESGGILNQQRWTFSENDQIIDK